MKRFIAHAINSATPAPKARTGQTDRCSAALTDERGERSDRHRVAIGDIDDVGHARLQREAQRRERQDGGGDKSKAN